MKASKQAIDLIKQFEGVSLVSYLDSHDRWAIGYGQNGSAIGPGLHITPQEAEDLLRNHVANLQDDMSKVITHTITQSQFDALVCLVYNIGLNAFKHSTLLKLINNGEFQSASDELLRWDHSGGKELPGLLARRRAERSLFRA